MNALFVKQEDSNRNTCPRSVSSHVNLIGSCTRIGFRCPSASISSSKAHEVDNTVGQNPFRLGLVARVFVNKHSRIRPPRCGFSAAQGCDRLALPRHLVSQICPVLLHPGLLDLRLIPPHRFDSEVRRRRKRGGEVVVEMHPSEGCSFGRGEEYACLMRIAMSIRVVGSVSFNW